MNKFLIVIGLILIALFMITGFGLISIIIGEMLELVIKALG